MVKGKNRSSHQKCSVTKGVHRNFAKFTGSPVPEACNFIKKEALAQVLSCEFYKISKNTSSTEHLLTTASIRDMGFLIGYVRVF